MPTLRAPERDRVESLLEAKRRLAASHVDLMSLLEQQIRLLKRATDSIEDEFLSAVGTILTPNDAKKLKELAAATETAVAAKVKLESHLKKLGESMTPAELLQAACDKIRGLPRKELAGVITSLQDYYNRQIEGQPGRKLTTATEALADLKTDTDE